MWGRNVSNLVSVESPYDNDTATLTLSREKVESYVTKNLNVNLQDDPAEWFRILDYTTSDNLYVNNMMVGDVKTTGRKFRENILRDSSILLRSAAFTVRYDSSSDQFIFQTKGYGHGAGMSQKGANAYASRGYSYKPVSYTHLDVYKRQGLLISLDSLPKLHTERIPIFSFTVTLCRPLGSFQ